MLILPDSSILQHHNSPRFWVPRVMQELEDESNEGLQRDKFDGARTQSMTPACFSSLKP